MRMVLLNLEAPTNILVLSFASHTVIISTFAATSAIQKWIRWIAWACKSVKKLDKLDAEVIESQIQSNYFGRRKKKKEKKFHQI